MSGPGLFPVVRRWWWLLLAGTVVGAAAAFIVASSATKSYQAEAKLLVGPVSGDYPTLQASGALGRTYAELAHSRRVVAAAARAAGVELTREQLDNSVSATSNDVTRIIDLQASYTQPEQAARLAGAVAQQLMKLRADSPAQEVDPVDALMRDPSLGALKPADVRRVRRAALHALGSPNAGDLEVIQAPLAPTSAASPRVPLLVALGALAGLLIAALYALMREGGGGRAYEDGFVLDEYFPAANGVGDGEDEESWLNPTRSGERP